MYVVFGAKSFGSSFPDIGVKKELQRQYSMPSKFTGRALDTTCGLPVSCFRESRSKKKHFNVIVTCDPVLTLI